MGLRELLHCVFPGFSALGALALAGCQAAPATVEARGFGYLCSGAPSDAACNESPGVAATPLDVGLPERIAVGSSVRFTFWPPGHASGSAPVPVADESAGVLQRAADAAHGFRVDRPGSIALAAFAPSGEVIGRARLEAFAVDHVGFDRFASDEAQPASQQSIPRARLERLGDRTILRAVPMNAEGDVLAGALACKWTSSNPGVVDVQGPTNGNFVTVLATGAGQTTLHVDLGGASADLPIDVSVR
jgi:hypothetical protein